MHIFKSIINNVVIGVGFASSLTSKTEKTLPSFAPKSSSLRDASKKLSKLLVKTIGKENLEIVRKEEDDACLLCLFPKISCKDLVQSTLEAPADGKVIPICERARDNCLEYAALRHLASKGKSPFTPKQTRVFLADMRATAIRGRARCLAIRQACQDKEFLEAIFDAREPTQTDLHNRP